MVIVIALVIIVLLVHLAKRQSKLNTKVDLILSQVKLDPAAIQIPDRLDKQILSYINKESEPLLVQKEIIRRNSIESAISCLTNDLMLPRPIAIQILIHKYNVAIKQD